MSAVIEKSGHGLQASGADQIEPRSSQLIRALRQIGYSFEQAISDLIDNSINASASQVLIRIVCDDKHISSVIVADDGKGMTPSVLQEAMRFGSNDNVEPTSLGKYGMGLKLASLSHAKTLIVLTRHAGETKGRRWTVAGISKGWECHVLDDEDANRKINGPFGGLNLKKQGTLVIWDDIDKLSISSSGVEATVRSLQKRLQIHLGLHFHRFLEDGRLKIVLDKQIEGEDETAIRVDVEPLNPFGYTRSGDPEFPKAFRLNLDSIGHLRAEAHIWPPNDDSEEYKLGNRAASRQGFYFYRNDRLIQAGGWNDIVQNQAEPHSSLARIRVDLPPEMDSSFGLNVQKSAVVTPPSFPDAAKGAKSDDGLTFDDYRKSAQRIYRNEDGRAHDALPLLPGDGIPNEMAALAKELLLTQRSRSRLVKFEWAEFDNGDLFELDRDNLTIYLNQALRKRILGDRRASGTDLPLLKMLLFFLLKDELDCDRLSKKRKQELEIINQILSQCAKLERG